MFPSIRGRRRTNTSTRPNGDSQAVVDGTVATPPAPVTDTYNMFRGEYAKNCKRFMDLNRDLRNLGGELFFDMPRLTVIGGQSAGKSSLVEAVSGITVPRDSGTCTRCPMECHLSTSATSWSCTISLRISFTSTGEHAPVLKQFAVLTNKAYVEIWLRRAQAAILNPHLEPETFHRKTEAELKAGVRAEGTLQFSKNTVVVDVKDPDVADLSFIDLPGLIQNSETDVIELVRDLVVSNIQGENTLILVTIPMSDDMENQQAVRLAREADPAGERTIGILTKPDTLGPGAINQRKMWKNLIEGRSENHRLKHGYYCVRLPDDAERARNISRPDSQRLAAEFFDTTKPWDSVTDRRRFGIPNFVADVGGLLVKLIENYLPELRELVLELLSTCEDDLSRLPAHLATEAPTEIIMRITAFCDDVRAATFGERHKILVQNNRKRYDVFKSEIYATRPNFWPSSSVGWTLNSLDAFHDGPVIDFGNVEEVIARSIGWELPGHVPFEATRELILNYTNLWDTPSLSLFDDIYVSSSGFIRNLILEHFGQYKLLESHVSAVTQTELGHWKDETLRMLHKILVLEKVPLFTQNTELLRKQEKYWLERYTNGRRHPYSYMFMETGLSPPPTPHVPEEDLDALGVMATVRGYFDVAHQRIIDYVPLAIEHELHQALAGSLQKSLLDSVLDDSITAERMKEFLSEDPIIAEKRAALLAKQAQLREIKKRLDEFHQ